MAPRGATSLALLAVFLVLEPRWAFSPRRVRSGGNPGTAPLTPGPGAPSLCSERGRAARAGGPCCATEEGSAEDWAEAEAEASAFEGFWAPGEAVAEPESLTEGFGLGSTADAALQRRLRKVKKRDAHRQLFSELSHCYVLVFDADTEAEGLYCVEQGGLNIVLGFESEADANVYGARLERQGFFHPEPRRTPVTEMIAFCWDLDNVKLKLVPSGAKLTPPRLNQPVLGGWGDEAPTLTDLELRALRERLENIMERQSPDSFSDC